jgi:hypothetical protein
VEDPRPELVGERFSTTVRERAAELKRELIRQTLEDSESWLKAAQLQRALAHPGEPSLSPIPPDEAEAYRNMVRTEYYEWLEPAFARYITPDPNAVDPVLDKLRGIEAAFRGSVDNTGRVRLASPALARIDNARGDMLQWEGSFQENFVDNFLSPLESVSVNQAPVAKVVREQLECHKVHYIRCRERILALLDQATAAAQTLERGRDPKSFPWGTFALAAVAAVATAVPGPLWLTAGGVLLDIGLTAGDKLIKNEEPNLELGAPTAQEVAVNISQALTKLDATLANADRLVTNALDTLVNDVKTARRQVGALFLQPPAIARATDEQIVHNLLPQRWADRH